MNSLNIKISVNEALVKLNVKGINKFGFTLSWMVKFYLYLLCAIATAAIIQLEKIRMI